MPPIATAVQALMDALTELRPATAYGVVGSRDVDQARYRKALDDALAAAAALLAQETAASRATECEQKQPNTDSTQVHLAVNGRTPGLE